MSTVRQTNQSGFFVFVNVRPGPYVLTVEMQGLKTAQLERFVVAVTETVTRNVSLEVGPVTEVVQVKGTSSELLQTTSAALGQVIEEKLIRELPTQGRNFTSMLLLTPGVNPVSTAQGPGQNGEQRDRRQQHRGELGNTGREHLQRVNPGAAEPLEDLLHGRDPEHERPRRLLRRSARHRLSAGVQGPVAERQGGIRRRPWRCRQHDVEVRAATASPVRPSGTGATRISPRAIPSAISTAADHPKYRQSQYGANLGGPVLKNRTFFFGSYDGWRFQDIAAITLTVPSGNELNGDFSQTFHRRQIYNPFTTRVVNGVTIRDPFPGNIIPQELISPTMQAFLKAYMVKPNLPGHVANNFQENRAQENNSNSFQARIDHHFSSSDNLFFRWTERRINAFLPRGDVGFIEPDSINRNVGGGYFHSFGNNLVLELRGGLATQPTEDAPAQHPLGFEPLKGLNLPELERFQGYIIDGLTTPWTNMPNLGVQGPRPRDNPNWNAAADVSWLRGKHNFKGGFQMLNISRLQKNQFGQLTFNPEQTRNPQSTANTGDPIASALLGLPSQIRGFVPDLGFIDFHTSTLSGYVQDTWALRSNVTLNVGLRYDYVTRAVGNGDAQFQSGVNMKTGEWLIALPEMPPVCAGGPPPCLPAPLSQIPFNQYIKVTGDRNSLLKPIADNWGPRAGVSWALNDTTVLRSGYALMWDSMVSRSQYGQHQFETWGWPQFSGIDTGAINREGGPLQRIDDVETLPFLAPRPHPWNSTNFFNDPDRKNAYSHQYHVELQRQITSNFMVAAAYVGSYNGRMEYAGRPQALSSPGVDATGRRLTAAEVDARRPWPHINGTFTYSDDIGMSQYDALQIKAQHRFSDGLSSIFSYTFSRTIDTSSGWFNAENGIGGAATVQNYHDIEGNKARSSYDIPHIVTWGTVWELPFGRGKRWLDSGALSWILGNWQLNSMLLARSGQPFTITVGGDPANVGFTGYSRANLVGDPEEGAGTLDRWFNPAAFAIPVNSFGTAKRNSLRAPSYWNVDLGLQRNIPFSGQTLQLRIDAFNAFNHINWGNPAVALDTAATVGRITTMNGRPRQIQFGAQVLVLIRPPVSQEIRRSRDI